MQTPDKFKRLKIQLTIRSKVTRIGAFKDLKLSAWLQN